MGIKAVIGKFSKDDNFKTRSGNTLLTSTFDGSKFQGSLIELKPGVGYEVLVAQAVTFRYTLPVSPSPPPPPPPVVVASPPPSPPPPVVVASPPPSPPCACGDICVVEGDIAGRCDAGGACSIDNLNPVCVVVASPPPSPPCACGDICVVEGDIAGRCDAGGACSIDNLNP